MNSPTEHKSFPLWEKKERKDKGYHVFEADSTPEKEEVASPKTKSRAKPSFKISKKDKTPNKGDKEEKERKKEKIKKKIPRKNKQQQQQQQSPYSQSTEQPLRPVIGVSLELAVRRSKSHDGVELPAFFRECIDYVESHGLSIEGIYRISPVKSKVQSLVHAINMGRHIELSDYDPSVIGGLIKTFLRELPDPVLTIPLGANFEEASALRDPQAKLRAFKQLLDELPRCNFLLLAWMVIHATHVISRAAENKMTLQNVSIVLSPTMQISHRVLNVFLTYCNDLFSDVDFRRYVPPLQSSSASGGRVELPDTAAAVEEELGKQESLLATLHEEIKEGDTNPEKEAQIWEVQRFCTQLKRKRHLLVRLVSRAAIEAELAKQEGHLARLHGELEKGSTAQEAHDELWEVQRTVTMLKRKLKAAQRPAQGSTGEPMAASGPLGSEEDVMLNLTLRKVDKGPEPVLSAKPEAPQPTRKASVEKAASAEVPKEAAVDVPRESAVDVPRESSVDVPSESGVDVPSESAVDAPNESAVDVPSESAVDVPSESAVDAPSESAVDVPNEAGVDVVPKAVFVDVPNETDTGVTKETAKDVEPVKEAVGDVTHETVIDASGEKAVDVSKEADAAAIEVSESRTVRADADELPGVSASADVQQQHQQEQQQVESTAAFEEQKSPAVTVEAFEADAPLRRRQADPPVVGTGGRVSSSSRSSSSVVAHSSVMDEDEERDQRSSFENGQAGVEDLDGEPALLRSGSESHRRSHLLSFGPMISLDDFVERGCLAAGESDLLLGDEDEDEELRSAFDDYRRLRYEEEELCAIGNDLTTRIQTERMEIQRLQREIKRLRGSEAGPAGGASLNELDWSGLSSEEEDTSEEEDEEELAKQYGQLVQDNERLSRENQALVENIQRERMLCAEIKVQMRMMTT